MAVTITPTPASGSITAKKTAVRFDMSGGDANDEGNFDGDAYPTSPEFRYVLTMVEDSVEYGRSQVFGLSPTGSTLAFNNYIFPHAGTWTCQVYDVSVGFTATATAATVVVA